MNPIIQKTWIFLFMLWISIAASAYDFEADGIYYTVVSVPELTCEVSGGPDDFKYSGDIKIPAEVSFRGKTLNVTRIGSYALFYCTSLTSVEIPNSVTEIGRNAFDNCSSLTSIEIPNSVTKIGEYAFYRCSSLTSIEIPNSVTSIGNDAFRWCTALASVKISNSVKVINAFDGCTSLTSIKIPDSVEKIGGFRECTSLVSVEIPNSVTIIYDNAFDGCTSLASISLPQSLKGIGCYAFRNTSLTSITIPGKVKEIENGAFYNCTKLDTINFEKGNGVLNTTTEQFGGVTCFSNTGNNKNVIIQRNIIANGHYVYDFYLDNIVSLTVGDSISVENLFCKGYKKLQNLVIGKEVSLSKHTNDSRYLSRNFTGHSGLQTLTLKDETPPFTIECTHEQYMNVKVRVPAGSLQAYQSADGWNNFWDIEEYGESSGIESAAVTTEKTISGKYDIYGRPVDDNYAGLVIIQYSDGTTEKVINR